MSQTSKIEWTDATANFWIGCHKVDPTCAHCYAESWAKRCGRDFGTVTRASDAIFYAPLRAKKWRELAAGSLVFTCSLSDFFHEDADAWRDEAWDIIRKRDDLTWQILTSRPENITARLPADWGAGWPHVWMGTTIGTRKQVGRADVLRSVPAAVRFLSCEPLLGPLFPPRAAGDDGRADRRYPRDYRTALDFRRIDWIIVGGESGGKARRTDPNWIRDLLTECQPSPFERRPAVFVKQLGKVLAKELGVSDWAKGGGSSIDEWPEHLRVREMPQLPDRTRVGAGSHHQGTRR